MQYINTMENRNAKVNGLFVKGKQKIEVALFVVLFEDNGSQIAYCPALNVYGYGRDEAEARESFETCLAEFFDYALKKKTLIPELEALGWTIKKEKKFTAPAFSRLLESNKVLKKIMDTKNFRKINAPIHIPAVA